MVVHVRDEGSFVTQVVDNVGPQGGRGWTVKSDEGGRGDGRVGGEKGEEEFYVPSMTARPSPRCYGGQPSNEG